MLAVGRPDGGRHHVPVLGHQGVDGDRLFVGSAEKARTNSKCDCRSSSKFVHIDSLNRKATPYSFETLDSVVRLIA